MKIINTKDANFKEEFEILARAKSDIKGVSSIVMNIIDEIVKRWKWSSFKRHIENLINGKLNQMKI